MYQIPAAPANVMTDPLQVEGCEMSIWIISKFSMVAIIPNPDRQISRPNNHLSATLISKVLSSMRWTGALSVVMRNLSEIAIPTDPPEIHAVAIRFVICF